MCGKWPSALPCNLCFIFSKEQQKTLPVQAAPNYCVQVIACVSCCETSSSGELATSTPAYIAGLRSNKWHQSQAAGPSTPRCRLRRSVAGPRRRTRSARRAATRRHRDRQKGRLRSARRRRVALHRTARVRATHDVRAPEARAVHRKSSSSGSSARPAAPATSRS